MNLLFWGLTISVVGKVMLAVGVLWAHARLAHEHRVDRKMVRTFALERWITIIGLLLIVFGYALEIWFYNNETTMLTCLQGACDIEAALLRSQ